MLYLYCGHKEHFFLYFMSKITSSYADYQTFPTLFELEPVAGKKVTVDFSAPELSSLGGLTLVREYEKSSSRIIERIESCIKDPRWEPMVIHSQTELPKTNLSQVAAFGLPFHFQGESFKAWMSRNQLKRLLIAKRFLGL